MDENRHIKGRGATRNPESRYLNHTTMPVDDGWLDKDSWEPEFLLSAPATKFYPDQTKSLITRNRSPDVPFEQSINAYRGCEHGCVYCFARPTHAYLDLSPGLDFETKIFYKTNVIERLREALENPNYDCKPIAMGTNTDPYQPIEREKRNTRQILEILLEYRHPVSIVTKGMLILRDIDLLQEFARHDLLNVAISITTLQDDLKIKMEPRCASPQARLRLIRTLTEAQIPVGVMVAPIIPMLNDHELEEIVSRAADAGASYSGYVMLRLPLEVESLFEAWLTEHYPLKAERVMNRVKDLHGGKAYDSKWGARMRGSGTYAELMAKRFEIIKRKVGFHGSSRLKEGVNEFLGEPSTSLEKSHDALDRVHDHNSLRTDLFRRPINQLPLFEKL